MVLLDATAATHAPAAAAIAASPPAAAVGMPLVLEQLCYIIFSFSLYYNRNFVRKFEF